MPARDQKPGIADLARMMKALDLEVSRCSRCGMCQAVCPVYGLTGHERDTARGKLALIDGLSREMFADADGTSARLNHCLLCGSCGAGCPMNIDATVLFLRARMIIEGFRGLSWWKRILFRWLVAHPQRFDRFLSWASRFQFLVLRQEPIQRGGSCSRLASPRLSDRHVVSLAPIPFHAMDEQKIASIDSVPDGVSAAATFPAAKGNGPSVRVAFFVGCLLDKVFPDTAKNIVDMLKKYGATVIVPEGQGCCGMPVLAGGDREAFSRLLDDHLFRFDPDQFDYLVTGCATCTATIKKFWPEMTSDREETICRAVGRIADKTHDISDFLVNILGISGDKTIPAAASVPAAAGSGKSPSARNGPEEIADSAAQPVVVTWHDPCHLAKTLGIRKEPRMLIQSDPACVFHEMPEPDRCCGMGGSFNLQYYDDSAVIGSKKVDAIRASGASVVATGCPACMIQLADMLVRADLPVSVRHVIDIVAQRK